MSDMQANVTISLKDEISSRLGTIGSAVETLSNKLMPLSATPVMYLLRSDLLLLL